MHTFKFENGDEVVDVITGFKGYIVYRVDNITGCNQYGIQPKPKKTETDTMPESKHLDENRLKATGKKAPKLFDAPSKQALSKTTGPVFRGQIPATAVMIEKASGVKGMRRGRF